MADKPIPFSGPMVRALLDGRKTQTRRIAKLPSDANIYLGMNSAGDHVFPSNGSWGGQWRAPYAIGDRLWVKETHWAWGHWEKRETDEPLHDFDPEGHKKTKRIFVRECGGDGKPLPVLFDVENMNVTRGMPINQPGLYKRRGMFMFRSESRLTLTVTDVRVHRLQEISEEDAKAEGATHWWRGLPEGERNPKFTSVGMFRDLWDSLNADRGFGWDANPWVAAYSFTVHRCNIDQMGDAA